VQQSKPARHNYQKRVTRYADDAITCILSHVTWPHYLYVFGWRSFSP
jgi:hypothetical protein